MAFSMRPHTFTVTRNTGADTVPPTSVISEILSGECNNQTGNSGNISGESNVMQYDYVLFHDELITTELKAGDIIEVDHAGKIINGEVKKALTGQLSNRIWYNELSK